MGLARGAAALLLEECARKPFYGRLATLGVQTLYMKPSDLTRQFERFSVKPKVPLNPAAPLDDKQLFAMMGFDKVETLDYSDFEGADHIFDLNHDGLPAGFEGQFDVVLDSGTLEHVFHVPNALKNIVNLVKVGGRVIFLSPSSNHLDHGFYMFSPTLFADYLLVNKFDINTCYVVRYSPNLDVLWDAYQYDPERWRDLHIGGLDDRPYAIFVVATRKENSTAGVIPQQNYYADTAAMYAGAKVAEGDGNKAGHDVEKAWITRNIDPSAANEKWHEIRREVGRIVRRSPFLFRIAQYVMLQVDKRHLTKKLAGRY